MNIYEIKEDKLIHIRKIKRYQKISTLVKLAKEKKEEASFVVVDKNSCIQYNSCVILRLAEIG